MIRILHAADLHLDSPFAALRPEQAAQRREEQRQMLVRLVRECNHRNCQLLLLAGDLFDSHRVYRETAELLLRLMKECRARVFLAPGNHDCYDAGSVYAALDWPENVHIFTKPEVETVSLSELGLTVCGAGFTAPHCGNLLRGFHADPGQPSVMVLHGELTTGQSLYNPISPEDVAASGLDYLALGHIHERFVRRLGRTTLGNPGCAIGRGFDEVGEKGALYVTMEHGAVETTFLPLGGRQYRLLNVKAEGDALAAVLQALPEDAREDICRLILTGTWESPNVSALERLLEERFYAWELVDQTRPPVALWAAAGEDSLKGGCIRRLKAAYDSASEEDKAAAALAARFVLALTEGREVPEL